MSGTQGMTIHVSALLIPHPSRRELLMVRKHGTTAFMLPGGKPEPGETARQTIIREVAEELRLDLDDSKLAELGTWSAPAANEAGATVRGTIFAHRGTPTGLNVVAPRTELEIAEAGWFPVDLPPDTAQRQFAALTRDAALPHLPEWFFAAGV